MSLNKDCIVILSPRSQNSIGIALSTKQVEIIVWIVKYLKEDLNAAWLKTSQ